MAASASYHVISMEIENRIFRHNQNCMYEQHDLSLDKTCMHKQALLTK